MIYDKLVNTVLYRIVYHRKIGNKLNARLLQVINNIPGYDDIHLYVCILTAYTLLSVLYIRIYYQ